VDQIMTAVFAEFLTFQFGQFQVNHSGTSGETTSLSRSLPRFPGISFDHILRRGFILSAASACWRSITTSYNILDDGLEHGAVGTTVTSAADKEAVGSEPPCLRRPCSRWSSGPRGPR